MSEQLVISLVGGALSGALAVGIAGVILRYFGNGVTEHVDLALLDEELDEPKRGILLEAVDQGRDAATTWRSLLLYGGAIAVGMAVVLRIVLSLGLDLGVAAFVVFLIWLLVTIVPPGVVVRHRTKRLAALEIALILERIARSPDEQGDTWAIRCSKKVLGADIFGAEEEDRLEFSVSRTDATPITLNVRGRVVVAPAGLDRMVSKRGLRELRLNGWFVNEIRDTEAEIGRAWSLHDSTYADIADELARAVEALGFPLRNVRLSRAGLDATSGFSPDTGTGQDRLETDQSER